MIGSCNSILFKSSLSPMKVQVWNIFEFLKEASIWWTYEVGGGGCNLSKGISCFT